LALSIIVVEQDLVQQLLLISRKSGRSITKLLNDDGHDPSVVRE
jgi:hypothetical protein